MKTLLEEIRSQPAHIREVFMWLCVVISFSVISFFWVQSTTHDFVALVNPQQIADDKAYAQANSDQQSVLATISQSASMFKDGLAQIFGFTKDNTIEFSGTYYADPVPPQLFPTSQSKQP